MIFLGILGWYDSLGRLVLASKWRVESDERGQRMSMGRPQEAQEGGGR
jgi:hypothetical protein